VLLAIAVALAAIGEAAAGKRRKRRKRANMPHSWAWPPNARMKKVARGCYDDLTELGVDWKPGPRTRAVAAPVVVESMEFGAITLTPIFRKPPFVIDCHLAVALTRVSNALSNSGISELRFSTIHDYRRVRLNGGTRRALSRHALGLAIDVYELVTSDGATVVIEDDYANSDHARAMEAALLRSAIFRAILTPGNDPRSHYDHFHLEAQMKIPEPKRKKKRRRKKRRR
jgi:hypothetical protein